MSDGNGSSRGDSSHLKSYPLYAHEISLPAEDWIYSSPLSSLHQLSLGVHGLLTTLITFLMPIQKTLINASFLACFLNCSPNAVFTFYEQKHSCQNLFSFANISILCAFCFSCLMCPDSLMLRADQLALVYLVPAFLSVFHSFWKSGKVSLQLPYQTYKLAFSGNPSALITCLI